MYMFEFGRGQRRCARCPWPTTPYGCSPKLRCKLVAVWCAAWLTLTAVLTVFAVVVLFTQDQHNSATWTRPRQNQKHHHLLHRHTSSPGLRHEEHNLSPIALGAEHGAATRTIGPDWSGVHSGAAEIGFLANPSIKGNLNAALQALPQFTAAALTPWHHLRTQALQDSHPVNLELFRRSGPDTVAPTEVMVPVIHGDTQYGLLVHSSAGAIDAAAEAQWHSSSEQYRWWRFEGRVHGVAASEVVLHLGPCDDSAGRNISGTVVFHGRRPGAGPGPVDVMLHLDQQGMVTLPAQSVLRGPGHPAALAGFRIGASHDDPVYRLAAALVAAFELRGIPVCLEGGSFLGSERHHSIIPLGDTDLDLAVFTADEAAVTSVLDAAAGPGQWREEASGFGYKLRCAGSVYTLDVWLYRHDRSDRRTDTWMEWAFGGGAESEPAAAVGSEPSKRDGADAVTAPALAPVGSVRCNGLSGTRSCSDWYREWGAVMYGTSVPPLFRAADFFPLRRARFGPAELWLPVPRSVAMLRQLYGPGWETDCKSAPCRDYRSRYYFAEPGTYPVPTFAFPVLERLSVA